MIYINEKNLKVKFPQVVNILPNRMVCINQTSKETVEIPIDSYEIDFEPHIEIFSDAQYDYTLYKDNTVVSQGILQINDFTANVTSYNNKVNIIQYNGIN